MTFKLIACSLLLMMSFTMIRASEPQLVRATKEDFLRLQQAIQKKFKPEEQSYFAAQPNTYLFIKFKNQYVEIMQHFLANSHTDTEIK